MFRRIHSKFDKNAASNILSVPQLFSTHFFILRHCSVDTQSNCQSSLIADFLVNALGFSSESALATSRKLNLKSLENANLVLQLLRTYGFSQHHISTMVARDRYLLSSNPTKTLKPKLDFLINNGISGQRLAGIVAADPVLLHVSLEKQIKPCFAFLRTISRSDNEIAALLSLKHGTWVFNRFTKAMVPNIETLRQYGVPASNIQKILMSRPNPFSRDVKDFNEIVKVVKETGFNPSSLMFLHGVCSLAGMSNDKWVSKIAAFESFGWSEGQVRSLFLKQPKCMTSSEQHIKKALNLFMNKWRWTVKDISKYPLVLLLSLEKRIFPRLHVLDVLISEGLLKNTCIGKALMISEDRFLEVILVKHKERLPQLLDIYQVKKGVLSSIPSV